MFPAKFQVAQFSDNDIFPMKTGYYTTFTKKYKTAVNDVSAAQRITIMRYLRTRFFQTAKRLCCAFYRSAAKQEFARPGGLFVSLLF